MAAIFEEVSDYALVAHAGPQGNSNARTVAALVTPNAIALLSFYPEGAVPDNAVTVNSSGGRSLYRVNYPFSQYSVVVDLLRDEKPVKFWFDDAAGFPIAHAALV